MNSLAGHFLISTPHMPDPRFREQVIYLVAHGDDGAMGLAVNNPSPQLTLHDILMGASLPLTAGPAPPVYLGGPVDLHAGFILFRADACNRPAIEVQPGVFSSRDARILEDIAHGCGPKEFLFLLGYAGWGAGQLERELGDNGWLVAPANPAIIFRTPDSEKWRKAAGAFDIDIAQFGGVIGRA